VTRCAAKRSTVKTVPETALHRRLLLLSAIALNAVVFCAFFFFERPGLGIGHFFYIPVAVIALSAGLWGGIAGGLLATALYVAAIVGTPRVPVGDAMTAATVIRSITYCSCGALIGWFANAHRTHVAQLRELAERDFLTGLLNARIFDEVLARRCAAGRRFALVLGDMDNLKDLNNAHGHTEGNRALRHVAEALTAAAGPSDEVARVGGDEFAVLTSGSVEEAQAMCALLKQRLAREGVDISFAWSDYPSDATGPLELFRKADDRLLGAKMLGRNRRAVVALTVAAEQ
jgi:diguanylate cyclase (GGDEF)-like protein